MLGQRSLIEKRQLDSQTTVTTFNNTIFQWNFSDITTINQPEINVDVK